jgi:hypothetical protein
MINLEDRVQAISEVVRFGENSFHNSSNTCLNYPIQKDDFELFKVVEGYEYKLVEIIQNNSKTCPKIHNSNTARYEKTGKRLPKDFTQLAIKELELQGEL